MKIESRKVKIIDIKKIPTFRPFNEALPDSVAVIINEHHKGPITLADSGNECKKSSQQHYLTQDMENTAFTIRVSPITDDDPLTPLILTNDGIIVLNNPPTIYFMDDGVTVSQASFSSV